eukprot:882074-Prymnesium_polylepis.1
MGVREGIGHRQWLVSVSGGHRGGVHSAAEAARVACEAQACRERGGGEGLLGRSRTCANVDGPTRAHAALSMTCAKRHVAPRVHEPDWNLKQTPPPARLSRGSAQSFDLWPTLPQLKHGDCLHSFELWPVSPHV